MENYKKVKYTTKEAQDFLQKFSTGYYTPVDFLQNYMEITKEDAQKEMNKWLENLKS